MSAHPNTIHKNNLEKIIFIWVICAFIKNTKSAFHYKILDNNQTCRLLHDIYGKSTFYNFWLYFELITKIRFSNNLLN